MIRTKLCKCTWQGLYMKCSNMRIKQVTKCFCFIFIFIFNNYCLQIHVYFDFLNQLFIDHFIKTRSAVLVFHDWVKIWIHLIRRVERKIRSNIFHLEEPLFLERLFKNLLNRFTNTTHHFKTCHKWYLIVSVRTDFTF